MTFTEDFLERDGRDRPDPRQRQRSRRWPTGIAAVRERGGRLFILGVGGSAGLGQPRGQRLPQDLRLRGLLADRQRLRAHRPGQRRGLGHHVRGVAARARGSTPRTPCWSSRSAAATPRRRSRPTSWPRSTLAKARRRLDLRHRRPRRRPHRPAGRRLRGRPAAVRRPHHPAHRGAVRVVWHLLVSHPALAVAATKWESVV